MGRDRRDNQFIIQGSILAAASFIVRIIGLIYRIPMTRIIGDEGMGLYSIAYELYSMTLILSSYSLP
ncbi:MAG: oligosaccharide flippase family protein [Clostridiales bacterium]|nr:oligosaccharide flippase family protein [Clostridiales bacterium]